MSVHVFYLCDSNLFKVKNVDHFQMNAFTCFIYIISLFTIWPTWCLSWIITYAYYVRRWSRCVLSTCLAYANVCDSFWLRTASTVDWIVSIYTNFAKSTDIDQPANFKVNHPFNPLAREPRGSALSRNLTNTVFASQLLMECSMKYTCTTTPIIK